jgi:hypothetical protein
MDKTKEKFEELESRIKNLSERVNELHKRIINHELEAKEYKK